MAKRNVANDVSNGQLEKDRPLLTDPVNRVSSIDDRSVPISEPAGEDCDPFNPAALRLGQDYGSSIGVKKALTVVPCRKPNRHEFVRVHPGEEWRLETGVFEDKLNRDVYLVQRHLWSELADEVYPACLFLAINRQLDVFLWPVKLPGVGGRTNTWNDSAMAAARLAERSWVRVASNTNAGLYDVFEAAGELAEPTWPELTFQEILRKCFEGRLIESLDHPVIRSLKGLS